MGSVSRFRAFLLCAGLSGALCIVAAQQSLPHSYSRRTTPTTGVSPRKAWPRSQAAQTIASGIGSEPGLVLDVLRSHPAFNFWPGRGLTVGYHLDTAQALPT